MDALLFCNRERRARRWCSLCNDSCKRLIYCLHTRSAEMIFSLTLSTGNKEDRRTESGHPCINSHRTLFEVQWYFLIHAANFHAVMSRCGFVWLFRREKPSKIGVFCFWFRWFSVRIVEMICERLDIQERGEKGEPRWSDFRRHFSSI